MKRFIAAVIAALFAFASPALADNYAVVDGNGALINFAAKQIGGILSPYSLPAGIYSGVLTPYAIDINGNQGTYLTNIPHVVCDSGCFATHTALDAGSNLVGKVGIDPGTNTVIVSTGSGLGAVGALASKQPALGTAGTPSADVLTVQGRASMTALKVDGSAVTQPVSGTVAVSGTVSVSAGTPANQVFYLGTSLTTGSVTALSAPGAGQHIYITSILGQGTSQACVPALQAPSGTNIMYVPIGAGTVTAIPFPTPIQVPTNTALTLNNTCTSTNLTITIYGYTGP